MKNIANTITDYLKTKIEGLVIYNDLFPTDSITGVIAVHDPSTRKIFEFIDGSAIHQLNIAFTARYPDAMKSRSVLDSILNNLDGITLSDSADGLELSIKTIANVQFIANDDKGNRYYTCSITVEYKTNNF